MRSAIWIVVVAGVLCTTCGGSSDERDSEVETTLGADRVETEVPAGHPIADYVRAGSYATFGLRASITRAESAAVPTSERVTIVFGWGSQSRQSWTELELRDRGQQSNARQMVAWSFYAGFLIRERRSAESLSSASVERAQELVKNLAGLRVSTQRDPTIRAKFIGLYSSGLSFSFVALRLGDREPEYWQLSGSSSSHSTAEERLQRYLGDEIEAILADESWRASPEMEFARVPEIMSLAPAVVARELGPWATRKICEMAFQADVRSLEWSAGFADTLLEAAEAAEAAEETEATDVETLGTRWLREARDALRR